MFRNFLAIFAGAASAVVLLPVMLIALMLRAIPFCVGVISRAIQPARASWPELMQYDSMLGWRPRPNLDTYSFADKDDVFQVITDSEGWLGRSSLDEAEIAVIGDSFAFGYGMDWQKSFAEVDPRLKVKSFGAPGYSMVQGVRIMEKLGPRLEGKLVVWFVFIGNDPQDNLAPNLRTYRAPFVRRTRNGDSWEIVDSHLSPEPWSCSWTNKANRRMLAEFCVPGPYTDRIFSACGFLIGEADRVCREAGARLAVISIPHCAYLDRAGRNRLASLIRRKEEFDPSLPHERIAASCREFNVPAVSGYEVFDLGDYKAREGIHWNEGGHRKMAGLLKRLAREWEPSERAGASASSAPLRGSTAGRPVFGRQDPPL